MLPHPSIISPQASELPRQRPLLYLMCSALAPTELRGFLLTRNWRDLPEGTEIEYWLATDEGPKKVLLTRQSSGSAQAKDSTYGWRMRARRLRFKSGVASAAEVGARSLFVNERDAARNGL